MNLIGLFMKLHNYTVDLERVKESSPAKFCGGKFKLGAT